MQLIKTESVTVVTVDTELDDLGQPTSSTESRVEVACIVTPGATADLDASRPNGVTVEFTAHFPKSWTGSLRGASVELRGKRYKVVGDPKPYTVENTPGGFNMPVELEAVDG